MKYKMVGLRVVDALRKEGKGTVQACRQTESLVGISERSAQRKRTQNTGTVSLVNDTREFESNGCSTGSRVTYARVTRTTVFAHYCTGHTVNMTVRSAVNATVPRGRRAGIFP